MAVPDGDKQRRAAESFQVFFDLEQNADPDVLLLRRVADVVGSERVARWIQTPLPALDDRTPISLFGSEEGRQQIEDVLVAIEHGDF